MHQCVHVRTCKGRVSVCVCMSEVPACPSNVFTFTAAARPTLSRLQVKRTTLVCPPLSRLSVGSSQSYQRLPHRERRLRLHSKDRGGSDRRQRLLPFHRLNEAARCPRWRASHLARSRSSVPSLDYFSRDNHRHEQAHHLFSSAPHDPDTLNMLGEVLDEAWSSILSGFGNYDFHEVEAARIQLATIVLDLARDGQLGQFQITRTAARTHAREARAHQAIPT